MDGWIDRYPLIAGTAPQVRVWCYLGDLRTFFFGMNGVMLVVSAEKRAETQAQDWRTWIPPGAPAMFMASRGVGLWNPHYFNGLNMWGTFHETCVFHVELPGSNLDPRCHRLLSSFCAAKSRLDPIAPSEPWEQEVPCPCPRRCQAMRRFRRGWGGR